MPEEICVLQPKRKYISVGGAIQRSAYKLCVFCFQVWLLEVNINPALHTNCQVLMDLLPGVVDETLSK